MVFIKKLALISLISSKKNDTPSSTEAPLTKYEHKGVRVCCVCFDVFYLFSEALLEMLKSRSHLLHTCVTASAHACQEESKTNLRLCFFK